MVSPNGDSGIYLRGSSKSQVNIWCWPIGSGEVYGYRTDASQPPEMRRILAATMIIAILVSLVTALTFVPVASEWLLRQAPEKEFRIIKALHSGYLAVLGGARKARWATLGLSLAVLVLAGFAATRRVIDLQDPAVWTNNIYHCWKKF